MTEEKTKKSKLLKRAVIVSVLMLVLTPLPLYHARNQKAFERRVEDLAAAGYPVSLADLEAAYVLPEGAQNAADLYEKAFVLLNEPNEAAQELLPVRGNYMRQEGEPPYPPQVMETVRQELEKNTEYLELLDQAARIEHCLFDRDFSDPYRISVNLTQVKKAAQILNERNLLLAQNGQTDELFESMQTLIDLPNCLAAQPQLIDHLVMIAIEAMTAESLEDSLNMTRFSDEQLATLQQQYRDMHQQDTMTPGWITERAGLIESLDMPPFKLLEGYSYGGSPSIIEKTVCLLYYLSGLKKHDSVMLLDFYQQQIDICQLPYHQQLAEIEKLEREIASYPWYHYGLHLMTGSLSRINEITLRVKGALQTAETALAIERYRLKHDSLPDTLQALVPEFIETIYLDPFDGKPIRYVKYEDGYMLYTIGEDGIDNGGLDREQMSKKLGGTSSKEYDHPFTVRRAEKLEQDND